MKPKYLSFLLLANTIGFGVSPAIANPSNVSELNFVCQLNNSVPTTIAQTPGGEHQLPIFHWREDILLNKTDASPQQLCNDVTAKLKDYAAEGYDLSNISFIGTEQENIPVICANTNLYASGCSKMLLTLNKAEQPAIVADQVVTGILDENLLKNKVKAKGDRGVQSTSYQIDFWSLLGLNFKLFNK